MGLFECTSDDLVEECNESYKRNDDAGAASRNSGTEERSQPSFLNTTQPVGCHCLLNLFLYILCDDIMQDLKDRELTGWRPACCLSRLEAKSRQERLNSCLLNDHLKKLNYCVD